MGSLSALSTGLQNSGVGDVVASFILKLFGENPSPFMVTTVLFMTIAILTPVSYTHLTLPTKLEV